MQCQASVDVYVPAQCHVYVQQLYVLKYMYLYMHIRICTHTHVYYVHVHTHRTCIGYITRWRSLRDLHTECMLWYILGA